MKSVEEDVIFSEHYVSGSLLLCTEDSVDCHSVARKQPSRDVIFHYDCYSLGLGSALKRLRIFLELHLLCINKLRKIRFQLEFCLGMIQAALQLSLTLLRFIQLPPFLMNEIYLATYAAFKCSYLEPWENFGIFPYYSSYAEQLAYIRTPQLPDFLAECRILANVGDPEIYSCDISPIMAHHFLQDVFSQ